MRLVFDRSEAVARWTAAQIPHVGEADGFGACQGVAVVGSDGSLAAGVVFHNYQPRASTIELSMAAVTPRWATRQVIRLLLYYPFEEMKLNKLWTATPHHSARAIKFNAGIGFTREAVLAHHFGPGSHAVIHRILRKDYPSVIERLTHGLKVKSAEAA